ncbi:MAG: hypothetical protein ABH881_02595 [bacterium]
MDNKQKEKLINDYLKTHFEEMLIKDIEMIKEANLKFTFPYILLVVSGIDFLGGLELGFYKISSNKEIGNSRERSCYFIEKYMGKFNDLYKDSRISNILYRSMRCGASHQAMYGQEIESSNWLYPKDKHLNHMIDFKKKDRIYIHALQLANDFKEAYKIFKKDFIKMSPSIAYDNLGHIITKAEVDSFQELLKELKKRGLSFDAKTEAEANPQVNRIDVDTGRVFYNEVLETTVTALHEEDDSKPEASALPSSSPIITSTRTSSLGIEPDGFIVKNADDE